MKIGELVGTGRTADVYALDDGRVLRRYRHGLDATGELDVMTYVAGHGYPVPAVWPGPEAGDLIMQRLPGPTMREALADGRITARDAGGTLAGLLLRLRAVPPRYSAEPAHRVLHLDLHPENVILTPDGPMVIDWTTAQDGPPGLDAAMSAVILAQAAVTMPDVAALARAVLGALLRRLDVIEPGHLAEARARRAADPGLSQDEVDLLDAAMGLITEAAES